MTTGKSVRLFLADGTPGGLLVAEIMNWTGHVVEAPRSDLAALLKRPEVTRTGVYILIGEDPDAVGGTLAYIGESDDISKRLSQHARPEDQGGKDFWDRAVVLTSKDANLTKAHARYLEYRFIALGKEAGRATLQNSTSPTPVALPEADVSDMEYFIEQARLVLPLLGVNILRSAGRAAAGDHGDASGGGVRSPIFEMAVKKHGVLASAQEIDGEFTVLEGSTARLEWPGEGRHYKVLRLKLEADGTLVPSADGATMVFARDCAFSSPSAAAAVVAGRPSNGRVEWVERGKRVTFGDWQARGVVAVFAQTGGTVE